MRVWVGRVSCPIENESHKAIATQPALFPLYICRKLYSVCVNSVNKYGGPVQFSRSVVSDSLRPHEPQHARPPCPSPTPGAYSNLSPLSRWCHPTISSSVVPFSSHLQSREGYLCAKYKNTKDIYLMGCFRAVVPNLFGTRGRYHGRQCFHRLCGGLG